MASDNYIGRPLSEAEVNAAIERAAAEVGAKRVDMWSFRQSSDLDAEVAAGKHTVESLADWLVELWEIQAADAN